jgi:adenylate cyclase
MGPTPARPIRHDASAALPEDRLRAVAAICDWLLGEARAILDPDIILEGLCLKLRAAGVAVDRGISSIELRHAEQAANARIWEIGRAARERVYDHARGVSPMSGRRPLAAAHRTNRWIFLWLPDTPDDAYDVVPELKAAGYVHYVSIPIVLLNGMRNGFTFATKSPAGFSADDIAVMRAIEPALAALVEILALHRILREVLRTYVGNEPHQRILAGDVRRGEVLRIRAAILFADMRDYTRLTSSMPAERATDLVNRYYDCIVPAVDERGGGVLKFIGDGVLAIFRAGAGAEVDACWRAFAAARAGLEKVAARNAGPDGTTPLRSASRCTSARPPTAMSARARASTTR